MKRKTLLLIATLVALPGVTYADSPFSSLQSVHEKNTILKDLRKMCTPKGALTDEAWEKKIMASEGNQQHLPAVVPATFPAPGDAENRPGGHGF